MRCEAVAELVLDEARALPEGAVEIV